MNSFCWHVCISGQIKAFTNLDFLRNKGMFRNIQLPFPTHPFPDKTVLALMVQLKHKQQNDKWWSNVQIEWPVLPVWCTTAIAGLPAGTFPPTLGGEHRSKITGSTFGGSTRIGQRIELVKNQRKMPRNTKPGNVYGCFHKWWYPQIIHFNRVFHCKPSILGYPYLLDTPIYTWYKIFKYNL